MTSSAHPPFASRHPAPAGGAADSVEDAADVAARRFARRRRLRLQVLGIATASFVVDSLVLAAFVTLGVVPGAVAIAFVAWVSLYCGSFVSLLTTKWCDRLQDHLMTAPQMTVASLSLAAFVLWVPQIGGLLLMLLFLVVGYGSLRMGATRAVVGAMLASLTAGAVLAAAGEALDIPMDTPAQRALSGLWFSLILARAALLGLYGSQLRELLRRRNAELAATFEQLEALAHRDELTGVLNRRSAMQVLEAERQRMLRTGQPFGVALFDLDHFKQINDRFGHVVGDEVLRRFVLGAATQMRVVDRLGRYGGEEFLLLLPGTEDLADAQAAADRVRVGIADQAWAELHPELSVTVSAGVSLCRPQDTHEQLLARVDSALYAAKRDGRNRVEAA